MAKVAFSKLNLKEKKDVKKISLLTPQGVEIEIEVKQYLSVNEKLILITNTIMSAHDPEQNYANPIKLEIFGNLEIVYAYTNLSFTDKQKEDPAKLYDLLESNGILKQVINVVPKDEYDMIIDGINDSAESIYKYRNSAMGILDSMSSDYSQLNFDISDMQKALQDPQNLGFLREVLSKMG